VPTLAELTWPEAERALRAAAVAILPVGSIEQHGPHLPLDTDAAIAEAFATRLADALGERAVLCPPVRYGLSEHHLAFAGTVTVGIDAYLSMLTDVVAGLGRLGPRRVLIVNGHAGNIDALRLVARRARYEHGLLVAHLMWLNLARDEIGKWARSPRYGHACEIETSIAMALMPDRVRLDALPAPAELPSFEPLSDPPAPMVDEPIRTPEWTRSGALGDPRLASREAGEAIVDVVHRRSVEFANRFVERAVEADVEEQVLA
jgi:creatinine amidohydrolase